MPQVGAAIQAAADALGRLGAKITPATMPDFTALYRSAEVMVKCEAAAMHRPWMEADAPYANQVRTRMEAGFFIPATQYIDALRLRAHFVREFLETAMDGVDAVLLPAIPFPIPTIEETDVEKSGGPATLSMVARFTGLTRPFNTLGLPALSVPCGFDQQRRADRPAACRPAVRRGAALPGRPRLPGRDRASQEGAGLALPSHALARQASTISAPVAGQTPTYSRRRSSSAASARMRCGWPISQGVMVSVRIRPLPVRPASA